MGHLIPAGSGFPTNRSFELVHHGGFDIPEGDDTEGEAIA